MKKLLLLIIFFAVSVCAEEAKQYQSIAKRNAFQLMSEAPKPILPPVSEILRPNIFLTGITRFNGVRKIHLVLRKAGEPDKFVSLATNEKQYNIELKKIYKNSALVLNDGNQQLMSFENNALPTIVKKPAAPTKESSSRSRSSSRDKKDNEKDAKKSAPVARPSIVKVPSRSRKTTDPRMQQMLERGLEYVSKIEDPEKKEAMLERMEKFQRGDYDQQIKEGMKRYEEYRKSRERRK
jgi:hypothetical protein